MKLTLVGQHLPLGQVFPEVHLDLAFLEVPEDQQDPFSQAVLPIQLHPKEKQDVTGRTWPKPEMLLCLAAAQRFTLAPFSP